MDILNLINNISWVAALCFLSGFILIIVEMHLPGFGVAGVSGCVLLILGIVLTARNLIEALILIIIILALLGLALIMVLQLAAKGRLSKSIILNNSLDKESGYIGTDDLEYFLDKEGKTVTKLRPSGTVDFDGVKLDVVSEGEFIESGTCVKVIKVQGRRIVVRTIE